MNKKRHTRIKSRASLVTLGVLSIFFATTCAAPKATVVPGSTVLTRPPVSVSATPTIGNARRSQAQADLEAERARLQAAKAREGLTATQIQLQSALKEADRLRKQKTASESELVAFYNQLVEQEKLYNRLVSDFTEMELALTAERALRAQVGLRLGEAEALVIKRDNENEELRRLLTTSEKMTASMETAAKDAVRAGDKLKIDLGVEKGKVKLLGWLLAGAVGLSVLLGILLYIRSAVPRLPGFRMI